MMRGKGAESASPPRKQNELLLRGGSIRNDDVFRSYGPRSVRLYIDDRGLSRVQVGAVVDDQQLGRTDQLAFGDFRSSRE
jgi:hypothetical protein